MKSENWTRIRAVSVAGVCLATLFLTYVVWAQETIETVAVNNLDRTYLVHLPRGYDHEQKYPVVILLHGMNQDTDDMLRLTKFNDLADKDSIIAVYPSALHGRWNVGVRAPQKQTMRSPMGHGGRHGGFGGGFPGSGGYPSGGQGQGRGDEQDQTPQPDDIVFLYRMLDQMATKFSVDAARIYATGLSEGGFMSMKVGCTMAERIAAIAPVGAAMPKTMICLPTRPVPVVMINGTSDPVVPYKGGTEHNLQSPVISVADSAKAWAKIDGCAEKPTQTKLPAHEKGGMETKVETYDGCQQGAQVVLYSVKGGGNTWPGGEQYEVEKQVGKTSRDLNANETIWSFLVTKKLEVKSGTDRSGTDSSPNVQ
jgi:polyhydroxybutyrate depolymerase